MRSTTGWRPNGKSSAGEASYVKRETSESGAKYASRFTLHEARFTYDERRLSNQRRLSDCTAH
jgi:hypothetical protein